MATMTQRGAQPAGTLRMSIAPGFGRQYILPLMPAFLARYPDIQLDWSFENRHVDLVKEGYDAAIGAGVAADANVVARELIPLKLLTVASPDYLERRGTPQMLDDLAGHECIRLRSTTSGRLRDWAYLCEGETLTVPVNGRLVFSDLDAILSSALAGMGLARLGAHHVLPYLDRGELLPVLGQFSAPAGSIKVYYPYHRLMPPKVRVFVDYLSEALAAENSVQRVKAMP